MQLDKAKVRSEGEDLRLNDATLINHSSYSAEAQASRLHTSVAYLVIKRAFDFLFSLVISFLMIFPLLLLMLVIVIRDPGNPLYFQRRVGQSGKPIYVAKLRTMRRGAERLESMLTSVQLEEYLREFKLRDDPRLIGWKKPGDGQRCFGAVLRKLSLDELPQVFYNICLRGDMSVVGPRPILQKELEKNYSSEEQREILSMKPGLTGYWQAYARNNATYESGERQRMELYYVNNCSIWLDVRILFHTVGAVFSERGAR